MTAGNDLLTGYFKKKAECLLMAMQDQTLATKASRVTLFEQQGSKKCRMFTEKDETVMHIPRECSKLVQAE